MTFYGVTSAFLTRLRLQEGVGSKARGLQCARHASTEAAQETKEKCDPAGTGRKRNRRLPASRYTPPSPHPTPSSPRQWASREHGTYQSHPPRYYRGPLHPRQPPKPSDPASREFIPGPFSLPRLEQTYHDTLASDYMTLAYTHFPPGYEASKKGERLRSWVGDSPYFKNRPLRGPRGGETLRLLRKPVTFRNVPRLEGVTVHTMVKGAIEDSAHLHVAGMVLQAITNVRAEAHAAKKSIAAFGIGAGQHVSVSCDLQREDMYHFLSKLVDVVMPNIKDWQGVRGSSGDSSGNIALGLTASQVALFPEVEVNYDMYPPKMIPGCHIVIRTSATTDRDARVLLTQIGIPFYGKLID